LSTDEVRVLAEERAALLRVATLVARGVAPEEVFAAVTEEIGQLLPVEYANMGRYEPDAMLSIVASWGRAAEQFPIGSRWKLEANNLATIVFVTGRSARIDSYADASGPVGVAARATGLRSSVAAPIIVEGRIWGALAAGLTLEQPMPADTEARLASFAQLVATAIANAESRAALARLADEQAALRRVATLVAQGVPPEEVFAAVIAEVRGLLPVDVAGLGRYESGATMTLVAGWGRVGDRSPGAELWSLEWENVSRVVAQTGRPARIDSFAHRSGPLHIAAFKESVRSSVGTPITVEGRLWGVMALSSTGERPLPADTEERLASFTELVATAIANAEGRAALAASRARIVAAADETRRRIERDLHDGTQRPLVSLIQELQATEATQSPEVGELTALLARTAQGLAGVLEEVKEIAWGIHPAIVSTGGLERALRELARRSAVPIKLDLDVERGLPEHVELAAYHVVAEALANAAKHADASVVHIELDTHDAILQLAIRDDGIGGADPSQGSGLVGLSDRVEALGGTLEVTSHPGSGTTLLIEIPLEGPSIAGMPDP
jgi:signal transduction histidine kinase